MRGQNLQVIDSKPAGETGAPTQAGATGPVAKAIGQLPQMRGTGVPEGRRAAQTAAKAEALYHSVLTEDAGDHSPEAERIAEARMKGYEGESCPECGNFTLVRNGTCLKCDTCGGTTGCS